MYAQEFSIKNSLLFFYEIFHYLLNDLYDLEDLSKYRSYSNCHLIKKI